MRLLEGCGWRCLGIESMLIRESDQTPGRESRLRGNLLQAALVQVAYSKQLQVVRGRLVAARRRWHGSAWILIEQQQARGVVKCLDVSHTDHADS